MAETFPPDAPPGEGPPSIVIVPAPPTPPPAVPPDGVPADYTPVAPPPPPGFQPHLPNIAGPVAPPITPPTVNPAPPLSPPVSPPATVPSPPATPLPPISPGGPSGASPLPPGPASGGFSRDSYARQVERVLRDTATRQRAERPVIRDGELVRRTPPPAGGFPLWGVLGRLAGAIGLVLWPSEIADSTLTPEQIAEGKRRFDEQASLGQDIARGAGIVGGGLIFGGSVLVGELGRLPAPIDLDDYVAVADVPTPDIAAPSPPQFPQLGMPAPPAPELAPPMPAPVPTAMSPPAQRPTPQRAPAPAPARFPSPTQFPPMPQVFTRLSSLTLPRMRLQPFSPTTPAPAIPQIPLATAQPFPTPTAPVPVPVAPPLTALNPQVLGSSPPAIRVPTQTEPCECGSKRRKQPRRCRARAPLRWAGGPRKGQSAGSRCYSFEE